MWRCLLVSSGGLFSLQPGHKHSFVLCHKKRWFFVWRVSWAHKIQEESMHAVPVAAWQHVPHQRSHSGFAVRSTSVQMRKTHSWLAAVPFLSTVLSQSTQGKTLLSLTKVLNRSGVTQSSCQTLELSRPSIFKADWVWVLTRRGVRNVQFQASL